ncbi:hypothetical protein JOQ06_021421, partial [Pogonophryne albipinna]
QHQGREVVFSSLSCTRAGGAVLLARGVIPQPHTVEERVKGRLLVWWDCGKADIKQLCLQYTLNVSCDITKSMRDLEMEIVELQSFAESTGNPGCIEDLKSKKAILADLLGSRAQGALVRSRFQSASMMDSPTKYFFSLEKKNGQGRLIHALRSAGGQQLTGNSQIRQRAVDFYCDLFTSEGLPTVSEETNKELDGPLTEEELCAALKSMQGGKAPGIDGLPPERLTGKKNWRPVSLLCTDYKLLSRALSSRLRKVMDQVVDRTQTYCVPGRSIVDNVSLIPDTLEVYGSLGFDTGLVSLDQEKAFDRVEHRYLWKVLERFGLSPGFIAKIKGPAASLFWLLEEPLVWGARLDVQDGSRPALSERLQSVGVVKLRNIVDAAGPGLHNTEAVASLLGLKSARHTRTILNEWIKRLSDDEMEMLREYSNRKETPDEGDPFPDIRILADQDGLEPRTHSDFQMQNGKGFYRLCTLALNKQKLSERRDTVWKQRLNVPGGCEPVWRLFYKPPLNKRSGDLQWRFLHGALGVNAFVSKINPTVSSECPFCTHRETITHCC